MLAVTLLVVGLTAVTLPTTIERASAVDERPTPLSWSRAVTPICAHALLFEGRHRIGTRARALAVAADIRASTERRLERVSRIAVPRAQRPLITRWLALERRVANAYATSYLGIYDVIAAARTPAQRAREPRLLGRLLHAPDPISAAGARLGRQLRVPDCTGGTPRPSPAHPASTA